MFFSQSNIKDQATKIWALKTIKNWMKWLKKKLAKSPFWKIKIMNIWEGHREEEIWCSQALAPFYHKASFTEIKETNAEEYNLN